MNASQVLDNIVPASDFNRGKATQAFKRSTDGNPVFVVKNNVPEHVIVTVDDYKAAEEAKEDLALLLMAVQRWKEGEGQTTFSREQIMEEFGITQEQIDAAARLDAFESWLSDFDNER